MHRDHLLRYESFVIRNEVNIDITHKCTLQCPNCARQTSEDWGGDMRKINAFGEEMSFDDFKKVADQFDLINFCGNLSDPIHHPLFDKFLGYLYENNKRAHIHVAASSPKESFFIKCFEANPDAVWDFGIDGLPKDSPIYRVNQDGEKLFRLMVKSRAILNSTPKWQWIIFKYNENDMDEGIRIAQEVGVNINFLQSSRWLDDDPLKPTSTENSIKAKRGNNIKELDPKCCDGPVIQNIKQLAINNRGELMPCCWFDTTKGRKDPIYKKLIAVSKINDHNSIEDILYSEVWQEFFEGLMNDKGARQCHKSCPKRGTSKETNITINTIHKPNGAIRVRDNISTRILKGEDE